MRAPDSVRLMSDGVDNNAGAEAPQAQAESTAEPVYDKTPQMKMGDVSRGSLDPNATSSSAYDETPSMEMREGMVASGGIVAEETGSPAPAPAPEPPSEPPTDD